jgi:hypothetical protein
MEKFELVDGGWVVDPSAPSIARGEKVPNPRLEPTITPPKTYYDSELNERERELISCGFLREMLSFMEFK